MPDAIMILNILFGATAVLYGLCSRNFKTAIVAGLLLGLLHAGLIALVGAQSGSMDIKELPYLKDAVDFAMQSGYLTFNHARYVAYLAAGAIALALAVIVFWLVRILFVAMGLWPQKKKAAI